MVKFLFDTNKIAKMTLFAGVRINNTVQFLHCCNKKVGRCPDDALPGVSISSEESQHHNPPNNQVAVPSRFQLLSYDADNNLVHGRPIPAVTSITSYVFISFRVGSCLMI